MLVLDPVNGVSGDMLLSALVGLGASEKKIKKIAKSVGAKVEFINVNRGHVRAKIMRTGGTKRVYAPAEMKKRIENMMVSEEVKKIALKIFDTLLQGEAHAHGSRDVHFHELAEADTIVDIVGAAVAIEDLKEKDIFSLPIAFGRTTGPAVYEIIGSKFPFFIKHSEHELTTPTGAAILTTISKPTTISSIAKMRRVAYGAGFVEMEIPNVLRAIVCDEILEEEIRVLETNVDDVSGEILGYAVEKMLYEGAKDACLIPIIAKKGRPGCVLQVMCAKDDVKKFCGMIFEETGTMGVREYSCLKHTLERDEEELKCRLGQIRIKVAKLDGRVVKVKPEYEDVKKIAKKHRMPLRNVIEIFRERYK